MTLPKKSLEAGVARHPNVLDRIFQYGTAGFRTRASDLDSVMFRMGLLAVLRSKVKNGQHVGVMITASHNPEEDNGVKLVDPFGDMLEVAWEKHATDLANISDADLDEYLTNFVSTYSIDLSIVGNVVIGRDTRPSSKALALAVQEGILSLEGNFKDYDLLGTPQLHYMVRCINTNGNYGEPTEKGYYDKVSAAFLTLVKRANAGDTGYVPKVTIDGANGIGAIKLEQLKGLLTPALNVTIVNDGSSGKLNHKCGADFVKVQQIPPEGVAVQNLERYASFDGDADRIVYFYLDKDGKFNLLDGDKIATLVAAYLKDLVSRSELDINIGLVQTAYANGSSTEYITDSLNIPVACVPTGVKHLHHRAASFDIGVYFEANGHGTVLFSEDTENRLKERAESSGMAGTQRESISTLLTVINVINQTVGDAISDMLLVEAILCSRGWGAAEWNAAYTDLPNRQLKVKVEDRNVIQTTDAERRTISPPGLQEAVDTLITKYNKGRAFVRPSGTEDVVRVYAEADTREHADQLAFEVSVAVYDMAGGVGDRP